VKYDKVRVFVTDMWQGRIVELVYFNSKLNKPVKIKQRMETSTLCMTVTGEGVHDCYDNILHDLSDGSAYEI